MPILTCCAFDSSLALLSFCHGSFSFFVQPATAVSLPTLSLHDALPISPATAGRRHLRGGRGGLPSALRRGHLLGPQALRSGHRDLKSTRLNSSHVAISYAVFCLKKKIKHQSKITSSRKQYTAELELLCE